MPGVHERPATAPAVVSHFVTRRVSTLCLQSDGIDLAKRRSGALSVRTPLDSAEQRGYCCTLLLYWLAPSELSAQIVGLVGRPGQASGDRWRRPKCGVEYELPKLKTAVFDH
jgi:hypothetical protein